MIQWYQLRAMEAENPLVNIEIFPEGNQDAMADRPEKEAGGQKGKSKKKGPTLTSQVSALISRLDKQSTRTDRLIDIMTKPREATPAPETSETKVVGKSSLYDGSPQPRKHVTSSHIKKRSPKNGKARCRYAPRTLSRSDNYSSVSSIGSESDEVDGEVKRALEMMRPRFRKHRGKYGSRDDRVIKARPFAYLDRELQREIARKGHPEELQFNHHLNGLCRMAIERLDERSEAYGLINHISQILEDSEFLQWSSIRPFSNTVISNVARGKWHWGDEKSIEKCRNNQYMRGRNLDVSVWSVPCPLFNRGRCDEEETHDVGVVQMRHVCAFCATSGYENGHTNRACQKRKGNFGSSNYGRPSSDEKREYKGNKGTYSGRQERSEENTKN